MRFHTKTQVDDDQFDHFKKQLLLRTVMKNLENSPNGDTGDLRVMESSTNITRSHQHPNNQYSNHNNQDHFYYQTQQQQQVLSVKSTSAAQSVKSHNLQSPQHIALLKASTMKHPTVAHSNTLPSNINRSSSLQNQYRNGVHNPHDSAPSNNGNLNNHTSNLKGRDVNILNNNLRNLDLENKKMVSSSSYIFSQNGELSNGSNGTSSYSLPRGFKADKFEIPLPFGYHLDLDFLRFCSDELVSGETLEKLKELRKERRQQRKTLEALMGIKQEQYRKKRLASKGSQTTSPIPPNVTSTLSFRHTPSTGRSPTPNTNYPYGSHHSFSPDLLYRDEFFKGPLKDAVNDFEQEASKEKCMTDSKVAYNNTFPRGVVFDDSQPPHATSTPANGLAHHTISSGHAAQAWMQNLMRQTSNSSLSSISTNSSALPYNINLTSPDASFVLSGAKKPIHGYEKAGVVGDSMETESITSITSEMSTTTLRNVREQMAKSLAKLKEYEKQVEAIPMMQVKLSVLKEEKRLLLLQLKQRELQMRRERGELTSGDDLIDDNYLLDTEMDTDVEGEENLEQKYDRMSSGVRSRWMVPGPQRRARSESPYAKAGFVHPDEFISMQKRKRTSSAGGYNSEDNSDTERKYFEAEFSSTRRMMRSNHNRNLSARSSPTERSEISFYTNGGSSLGKLVSREAQANINEHGLSIKTRQEKSTKKETKESASNTDPIHVMTSEEMREAKRKPSPPPKPRIITRDRSINTDPPPRSPPPPRKISHATNTVPPRTMARASGTDLAMDLLVTLDEMEAKIQEAVFKTEEEIMGCPLLQKAMAKVEEEALNGPQDDEEKGSKNTREQVETLDVSCQVGDEHLKPFVITVGLQCKIEEDHMPECTTCLARLSREGSSTTDRFLAAVAGPEPVPTRSIGVGECKVIEDPTGPIKYKDVGVCTEKWVEVIKASKQTDTEDFAFKDTESPRVADMVFPEALEPDRIVLERRSSLRRSMGALPATSPFMHRKSSSNSPVSSRKSSAAVSTSTTPAPLLPKKVVTKSIGINTEKEKPKPKIVTKDAKTQNEVPTRNASTSALILPLVSDTKSSFTGSPLTTPEIERPPVNLNLCDKCSLDIKQVAEGIIAGPNSQSAIKSPILQPPSPNLPWLSKIPRPVAPENPDVYRLKSATSTGNLSSIGDGHSRPKSPMGMQRSKSNLTPSVSRRVLSPKNNPLSPTPSRGNIGTPPPHPSTPPLGMRRVSSPLARSHSPATERKSLIPQFSPGMQRKKPNSLSMTGKSPSFSSGGLGSSGPVSPASAEMRSLIPRVQTPPALRKMYPKDGADKLAAPDRNVVRKQTYNKDITGVRNPALEKGPTPTPSLPSSTIGAEDSSKKSVTETDNVSEKIPKTSTSSLSSKPAASKLESLTEKIKNRLKEKLSSDSSGSSDEDGEEKGGNVTDEGTGNTSKRLSSSGFPLPGAALFTPIDENRKKAEPSKEMRAALKVLNDSFARRAGNPVRPTSQVTNAVNIIQQEWFKTSSTKQSNPLSVEDYLDAIEDLAGPGSGRELLSRVVNMTDVNGNTALHYSVSHGNFDVVSVLLDAKVANPNILNKAGYTCTMLISLAQIINDTHRAVITRLFGVGDVNIRACQHGQTALMLAVSHGRLDMVKLLVDAGADLNIRDEDGSTALMCAAEHGYMEMVKYLMAHPDADLTAKDNDGLTALAVAMEAGHRDIGVVLYAGMSPLVSRGASPRHGSPAYSSMRIKRNPSGPGSSTSSPKPSNTPPVRGAVASSGSKIPAPSSTNRSLISQAMQRSKSFTNP